MTQRMLGLLAPRSLLVSVLVALASIAVHAWIAWQGTSLGQMTPFNDVNLYSDWVARGLATNQWPGTNEPGVYPVLALLPMILAHLLDPTHPVTGWLMLMTAINTAALVAISRSSRGVRAAAFWLVFLLLLGPVGIGRIDAVAVAVDAFVVLAILGARDRLGAGLATAAAWIKIWPVAHFLAIVVRERNGADLARKLGVAAATSLVVLAFGIALGGNQNLFSFLGLMGNRGLQIEAPIATPWMWAAAVGWEQSSVYFESNIITYQVTGPGSDLVAKLSVPALAVALGITAWLGWRAVRAGVTNAEVFVLTGLTATLDLIVFNKVGSPQFESWLAVPVLAGLLAGLNRWRVVVIAALLIAALTQWVYPLNYDAVVSTEPAALLVLTVRNALLIALLVWANLRLAGAAKVAGRTSPASD